MAIHIGRRQVIFALGNAVVALPLAVRAQQPERCGGRNRRAATALVEDDPEMTARLARFRQGLQKRGWSEGRNVSIDICFAPDGSADQAQVLAKELIALQPDVILAHGTSTRRRVAARA